jgi:hypothetical protein
MSVNSKSFIQPIDRVAIALMLVLSLLIGLLVWRGDAVAPRVRSFSWQERQIGAADKSFNLTFSRPMDTSSVEANLEIDPPLPGKFSWAGRRMAYTLLRPAPYGNTYHVQLRFARDKFTPEKDLRRLIQPFDASFRTRDRAFVYLGVQGEEQGRLVFYNFTQQQKTILTPKNLVVVDFKPYPTGDKILFSATERTSKPQGSLSSQIYTVTTGISTGTQDSANSFLPAPTSNQTAAPGKIDLVLDNKDYQNLKFDLSPDGNTIVVQRVSQLHPDDLGFWIVRPNSQPQPMQTEPGGDFAITPDSTAIAVAQGQGVAILPLQSDAKKPLDFLPQFGMVLDFAPDGSQAAMVKFNTDYTRSLFLVMNQGAQKELLRTTGSILSAQFDPRSATLYCLLTQLLEGENYEEQPYLAAIDLKTGKQTPLVVLPNQRDVQMSLSADGLGLLFDQVIIANTAGLAQSNLPRTDDGEAIATSRLWLIPLPTNVEAGISAQLRPEQLPLPGFHPRWLP